MDARVPPSLWHLSLLTKKAPSNLLGAFFVARLFFQFLGQFFGLAEGFGRVDVPEGDAAGIDLVDFFGGKDVNVGILMPRDQTPLVRVDCRFDDRETGLSSIDGVERLQALLGAGDHRVDTGLFFEQPVGMFEDIGVGERHVAGHHGDKRVFGHFQSSVKPAQGAAVRDDVGNEGKAQITVPCGMIGRDNRLVSQVLHPVEDPLDQRFSPKGHQGFVLPHAN